MEADKNYICLKKIDHLMSEDEDPTDGIKKILESGFDLGFAAPIDCTVKHLRGQTAFHVVISKAYREYFYAVVDLLISYGADITCKSTDGYTPLRNFFNNITNRDDAPRNFWGILNKLLFIQVDSQNTINPCCKDKISHFHIACTSSNKRAVEFFLNAGVCINEAISHDSSILPGYTALHIAMRNKDKDIIHLLVEHGADLKCLEANGMSPLQLIYYENLKDEFLETEDRIHFKNRKTENRFVLNVISKPNEDNSIIMNCIGLNKLHKLCIGKYDANKLDDIKKLVNDGIINSHVNFDSPLWPGYSALHFAVQNNGRMLMLLLLNGADLLAKDASGTTPLDFCCNLYTPGSIGAILKTQIELRCIKFSNGEYLVDILDRFDSEQLQDYLETAFINNSIPLDSPLWPGFSLLHLAVLITSNNLTKLCLQYGADYTARNAKNMTPLHLAFQLNKVKLVDDILEAHSTVSVNPVNNNRLSHFHIACFAGNAKVVDKFLQHGVNPDSPTTLEYVVKSIFPFTGETRIPAGSGAFHIAAAVQSEDLVKLLIKSKADPNLCDADGFTWVHRISFHRESDLHQYLWEHPEALKSNPIAPGGLSHFHIACCTGDLRAIKALLPLTANINEPINSELEKYILYRYYKNSKFFYFHNLILRTPWTDTPLHLAAASNKCSEELIDMLLKNGADVAVKNSRGYNPVYVCYEKQRFLKICERPPAHRTIIKRSNTPDYLRRLIMEFKSKGKSPDGITSLHFACALKDVSLIKEFLEEEEDFNSQIDLASCMWSGFTPLGLLIRQEYLNFHLYMPDYEAINLILEKFLGKIENMNKALHELPKRQRVSSLKSQQLIVNDEGRTAFHVACMGIDPHIVERFIAAGVDINNPAGQYTDHDTPLHSAVWYGSKRVLEMLLQYGADISIEDKRGYTPVQLAAKVDLDKFKIFLRLRDVDGTKKNTYGRNLVDLLLENTDLPAVDCLNFLMLVSANNIDSSTKLKCIKSWARKSTQLEFKEVIDRIPDVSNIIKSIDSSSGQNIVHHLVSTKLYLDNGYFWFSSRVDEFASNMELVINKGCELDHQDVNGKTPLHYAVISKQEGTVKALLKIGADINIVDKNGITPYGYCYEAGQWNSHDKLLVRSDICRSFQNHVTHLRAAGLYLNDINNECYQRNVKSNRRDTHTEILDRMARKEIFESFFLRTLLTEKIIIRFPLMPLNQRRVILEYLESDDLRNEYPDWMAFFKLQHRKLLKSEELFNFAFVSLRIFLDHRLPDHCLESILAHLSLVDWYNLYSSASE